MKHSCSAISKLLEKYFDHELIGEEKKLVEAHLLDCQSCQETLKTMEKLRVFLRAPVEEAVQSENFQWLWQKIERKIQLDERVTLWERLQIWLGPFLLFRKKLWIPAAVAAMIILTITIPIFFKKTPSFLEQSVIEYVESQTHHVMIFESENKKVTVIWLFEDIPKEPSTS